MRRVISLLLLLVVLGACKPPTAQPLETPSTSPHVTQESRETQPQPVSARFFDCEDRQRIPCITFDEGEWRVVDSYSPYRFIPLPQCDAEDYPTVTPCVWKRPDANGKWIVVYYREG